MKQVKEIKSKFMGQRGEVTKLAKEYGVAHSTIGRIRSRKIWGWL